VIQKQIKKSGNTDRSLKTSTQSISQYPNFENSFIVGSTARQAWQTGRDTKQTSSTYWSRFENVDNLLNDDSDSDMDYNSGKESDDEEIESTQNHSNQRSSQAPKTSEQIKQVPQLTNLAVKTNTAGPPQIVGKLNLKGIKDQNEDEEMKQHEVPPKKTGFTLDISKA